MQHLVARNSQNPYQQQASVQRRACQATGQPREQLRLGEIDSPGKTESRGIRRRETLEGAASGEYAADGRDYHPRGGPFQSVDELKLVLGMTPALYERLAPAVTVFSGRSKVNLTTAPKEVLMALAGQDAAAAAATVAARQGAVPVNEAQIQPIVGGVVQAGIPIDGWVFSIRVWLSDDHDARQRALRILPNNNPPFLALSADGSLL